jgi:hypothetical protein
MSVKHSKLSPSPPKWLNWLKEHRYSRQEPRLRTHTVRKSNENELGKQARGARKKPSLELKNSRLLINSNSADNRFLTTSNHYFSPRSRQLLRTQISLEKMAKNKHHGHPMLLNLSAQVASTYTLVHGPSFGKIHSQMARGPFAREHRRERIRVCARHISS